MPEAPMDEDDGVEPGQNEIRRAGEAAHIQSIAVAETVDDRPDLLLGLRVPATDCGHDRGPLGPAEDISHP